MKLTPLTANTFASDGGAMFGLVPKGIWGRDCPADADNMIPQRANAWLIETDDGARGLLDTGCGDPRWHPERERAWHQLESDWLLPQSLEAAGVAAAEIDFVLLSHAHWDHAGGLLSPEGVPTFPNARIYLRRAEADCATGGDPLLYKSYPEPIRRMFEILADRIFAVSDEEPEVFPGIYLLPAAGHTAGQACVHFSRPQLAGLDRPVGSALFTGDNCPTRHHLRMVFQTAYDTLPLQTREWKRQWWPRCAENGSLLLFTHDPDAYGAWIAADPRKEFVVRDLYTGSAR
jgi:glyoxylase-like metal-dependent hydrolase (beta-lactamase superfamily II)